MGEWGNLVVGLWKSPLPFQTVKGHAIKSGSLQGNWVVQVSVNPSLGALVEWWSTVVPPSHLLCTCIPEHSVVGMAASAGEHIDNWTGAECTGTGLQSAACMVSLALGEVLQKVY